METTNETDPPPPPPPPQSAPPPGYQAPPRRLTRSSTDKVVAGVSGGLGHYFGIDPVIFRIAFVVLTLAGGTGLILYVLGWLLVPEDTAIGNAYERLTGGSPSKVAAAVLGGLAVILLFDQLARDSDGGAGVGIVLLGLGAAMLWSRKDGPKGEPAPPAGPPPGAGPAGTAGTVQPASSTEPAPNPIGTAGTTAPPPPPGPEGAPPVVEPTAGGAAAGPVLRPRSVLVPVTLSLLALLAGGLALLDATVVDVSLAAGFALALLLTGGALIVGAWRGRGRALIPLGLVLVPGLMAATVIDVPLRGGAGDRFYRPASAVELDSPYRLAAGDLTVDLSDLELAGSTRTVVVSVAVGKLRVVLPQDANVSVAGHVGVGELAILGQVSGGFDVDRIVRVPGAEAGGRLVVRPRVGVGQVEVTRAAA